jgi:hypothetical protein
MSCPHEYLQGSLFYSPSAVFHNTAHVCTLCGRMRWKFYLGSGDSRRIIECEVQPEDVKITDPAAAPK